MLQELETALEIYRETKRLEVVKPFAELFDPFSPKDRNGEGIALKDPSHRGLYWAFSFQFSLMGWSDALLEVLKETINVERKRKRPRWV